MRSVVVSSGGCIYTPLGGVSWGGPPETCQTYCAGRICRSCRGPCWRNVGAGGARARSSECPGTCANRGAGQGCSSTALPLYRSAGACCCWPLFAVLATRDRCIVRVTFQWRLNGRRANQEGGCRCSGAVMSCGALGTTLVRQAAGCRRQLVESGNAVIEQSLRLSGLGSCPSHSPPNPCGLCNYQHSPAHTYQCRPSMRASS